MSRQDVLAWAEGHVVSDRVAVQSRVKSAAGVVSMALFSRDFRRLGSS